MSYAGLLIHRASILRKTQTGTDSHNLPTYAWAAIATGVHCRYEWRSRTEMVDGKRVTLSSEYVYFPSGTDILEKDRISSIVDLTGATMVTGTFGVDEVKKFYARHKHHHVSCRVSHVTEAGQ